jgi:hypothetical protein
MSGYGPTVFLLPSSFTTLPPPLLLPELHLLSPAAYLFPWATPHLPWIGPSPAAISPQTLPPRTPATRCTGVPPPLLPPRARTPLRPPQWGFDASGAPSEAGVRPLRLHLLQPAPRSGGGSKHGSTLRHKRPWVGGRPTPAAGAQARGWRHAEARPRPVSCSICGK